MGYQTFGHHQVSELAIVVEARAQVSLDRSDVDNSSSHGKYSGETNLKKQMGKRKHWTIRNLN